MLNERIVNSTGSTRKLNVRKLESALTHNAVYPQEMRLHGPFKELSQVYFTGASDKLFTLKILILHNYFNLASAAALTRTKSMYGSDCVICTIYNVNHVTL